MITKKLGKITFAFDPIAFDGRGYWFVLGKNGGLGRAATEDESKKLRRPKESELYPHRKAEKRAKINPQKEEEEISFEERERLLAEDALRRNRRVRYYGKIAKTTSEYEKAAIVRSKTLGQVASERMLRGQMPIAALKGAFKEKIGARGLAIKEKFDPLNLLNKIPALGGFLSTAYGIKTGRSAADISYFTGAGRFLRQQRQPGQFQDTAIKIPSSENTGSLSASLVGIKTPQGVMKRIYVLLKEWHDEDMRLKEETKRKQEIADNFKEEQDQERHKEMMAALLGKDYKGTKGKGTDKATPQDQKGFFEKLKDELVHDAGLLAAFNAKSLLKFVRGLLPGLAEGLAAAFSAEFLATLGGIAAGTLFLKQGVKHYKEKFGGADKYAMEGDVAKLRENIWKYGKYDHEAEMETPEETARLNKETRQRLERASAKGSTKATEALKTFDESKFSTSNILPSGSEKAALEFFKGRGWTAEQAAGIVSNLKSESSLNPNAQGDNGRAYGIAQWHPDRQKQFEKVYGKPIQGSSVNEQLEFVDWELKNTESKAGDKLKQAKTAKEAGSIVSKEYERPADKLGEAEKRGQLAESMTEIGRAHV